MRTTWTFHSAGQLVFGPGSVAQLGSLVRGLGLKRLLLVTDAGLAKAGVLVPVEAALGEAGIDVRVFDGGQPEPSLELVAECLARGRDFQPDGVLGLGGGSNMDLSKGVALVLTHGGTVRDYVGDSRVPGPVMPIICVPTTSGTGSEVTAAAVLTDAAAQVKVGVLSNHLRPRLAVVDPRLALSCPAKVTADSGIDALTHAIEACTAVDNAEFPLPTGEVSVYQGRHP
ncbi:MAG TPA: iron-containing alcohol dehydrogenase, partial [Pirellulales bacterium]|nr:iron-containing alcohol dehydrogenase [Pirellulales bacterium]